ncbi:MAG: PAS domain-containing protein [Smithellaceae bacterium]|nr:PAS domain-containing protein [Smithellaceae bacterium]
MKRLPILFRSPDKFKACFSSPALPGLWISLTILLFLLLPLWWYASHRYEEVLTREQRALVTIHLTQHGNALTRAINERVTLLEGLHAFTLANPSADVLRRQFDVFASGLYSGAAGIRNLTLAPGGVQRYVYPLRGNENVPGHDLISDPRPEVRADVQRAMKTRKVTQSGPYELRQGGMGLVARKAIYVHDAFWGLATITIDMPPILTEAELSPPRPDIVMALRSGAREVIFGNARVFEEDPVTIQIELPEGHWELDGIPPGGWRTAVRERFVIFRSGGLIIALLIAGIAHLVVNRQTYLKEEVRKGTAELRLSNERLSREIEESGQTGETLRESEERLRLSTELANVAVWEYSFITNSMSRSINHDQLYGLERHTTWDINTFLAATHPDDREFSNNIIQKSVAAGGSDQYSFDFRVVYPDQSIHWLSVVGQVVQRNMEGQGSIVRGCLIDITDRKHLEDELRKLTAELGQRVKDRTAELEARIAEIERMNKLFVGRELRMIELKEFIKKLETTRAGVMNDRIPQ